LERPEGSIDGEPPDVENTIAWLFDEDDEARVCPQASRNKGDFREKTMRHLAVRVLAASALCAFASCHKKPSTVPGLPPTNPTYQMSDGLHITPLDVERNEIADILGIQMWQFHVACPSPETAIHYTLELRKQGQPRKEICNGTTWVMDTADCQMAVALYPLDGEIHTADKLKTRIRIGGAATSSIRDNPMKGLGGSQKPPGGKETGR